ncbi:hypothetical protein OF83DRAFT_1160967 [Amylostereum chailletii]|nr:hypothetical protein OF83DRAFT_1160967 [Amylostereum chailletii]
MFLRPRAPLNSLSSRIPSARRWVSSGSASQGEFDEFDVVIVGGGPAGLALASALASSSCAKEVLKVALIEASDLSKVRDWSMPADAFSNRVSSLTNLSQGFLKGGSLSDSTLDIGVWQHVAAERTCPVANMEIWDGISDARISFNGMELGAGRGEGTEANSMARLTENLNLQRALLRHLESHPTIRLLDKTKVESIHKGEQDGVWPVVHLSGGQVLRARLLVGADGFNSPVRSFAGIHSYGWNYPTQAIVATLQHSPRTVGSSTTAYQRFLPTGPIAFLPLSPTSSSLVWSTRPTLAAALTKADPSVLAVMINAAFRLPDVSLRYLHSRILDVVSAGNALDPVEIKNEIAWREESHSIGAHSIYASALVDPASVNVGIPPEGAELLPPLVEGIQVGTMASFPLRFNHAESYIGEGKDARTVLVGDAAHTIHPLAGQGLNLGLADVECLARCIENTVVRGGDIGSYTALMPYARERYLKNHAVMSVCDKLHKIYAAEAGPIVWARSVGVEVLNELDTLKAGIMMSAGSKHHNTEFSGWNMAAAGIEAVSGGVRVARAMGDGLRSIAAGALRMAGEAMAKRSQ